MSILYIVHLHGSEYYFALSGLTHRELDMFDKVLKQTLNTSFVLMSVVQYMNI